MLHVTSRSQLWLIKLMNWLKDFRKAISFLKLLFWRPRSEVGVFVEDKV